jgi:hypothetical protein
MITSVRWYCGITNPKGGDAYDCNDVVLHVLLTNNLNNWRIKMSKKNEEQTTVATTTNNNVDGINNSNTENVMNNTTAAASGVVTLTRAEYDALVAKAVKKPGEKSLVTSKKISCKLAKKDIRALGLPPQLEKIAMCAYQETEANPDVAMHDGNAIIDRLLDEDNDHAMHFSATYRTASVDVKRKRLVEIVNYYAHPDFAAKFELDDDTFIIR